MTTELTPTSEHILHPICQAWDKKLEDAKKRKWKEFGQYAVEGMNFFDGTHDWMWQDEAKTNKGGFLAEGASMPTFRMQINRMFEAVALFGPALYHRNPDIQVKSIDPPFIDPMMLGINPQDPNMQATYQQLVMSQETENQRRKLHGGLKQHYLNWLQVEADKKTHARRSITEAIVKGMGILYTEMFRPPGSSVQYPFSRHISVDTLLVDPDAEYWEDVQYIAIKCCHPVNLVEREYGLPEGVLRGRLRSSARQGEMNANKGEKVRQGRKGNTYDLIEYYKIYSKNGFGGRLKKNANIPGLQDLNTEVFGDMCKIVVAKGIPYPLNLPTPALKTESQEQIMARVRWEVPFWSNNGGWPISRLHFYDKPRCVWPISLVKPAVGELRFVNWCMSFLADKVAAACTTYVGVAKAAGLEIQDQIKNKMAPYTVLEISQIVGKSMQDTISFLDAPNFSVDIWRMLAEVLDMIDKLSTTASNEMAAAVWACGQEDVAPVLGGLGASVWTQDIQGQEFERIIRDFDYRVGAGSARKPNKNAKQRALIELGNVTMSTFENYAMQGQVGPWNAYISDVCEAMDLDASKYLLPEPEPQEGPTPEEEMAQMEMKMKEFELEIKQAEFELKAQESEQKTDAEAEKAELARASEEEGMEQDEERHIQELRQDAQMHRMEMEQKREEAQQDILIRKAQLAMVDKENQLKLEGIKKMQAAQLQAKKAQAAAQAKATAQKSSSSGDSK
jgi:hypothetical protein